MKHLHVHILGGGFMPRPNDQDWGESATNAAEIAAQKAEIAALEKKADVIVLCSSDPEYDEYAPAAFKYLNGRTEFVIAGPENDAFKELGIKYFINVKSNVQATLTEFNAKLLK